MIARFKEISLKGCGLFWKDGVGRQVGGLMRCEKECLGCVELYLGTADKPMESAWSLPWDS